MMRWQYVAMERGGEWERFKRGNEFSTWCSFQCMIEIILLPWDFFPCNSARTLLVTSMSAPAIRRIPTTSKWPRAAAEISAVLPSFHSGGNIRNGKSWRGLQIDNFKIQRLVEKSHQFNNYKRKQGSTLIVDASCCKVWRKSTRY